MRREDYQLRLDDESFFTTGGSQKHDQICNLHIIKGTKKQKILYHFYKIITIITVFIA